MEKVRDLLKELVSAVYYVDFQYDPKDSACNIPQHDTIEPVRYRSYL
jgi:hypothetical protein